MVFRTVENILRWLFQWVDKCLIAVVNAFYNLLMNIASLNIVDNSIVKGFAMRIGLILGLFVVFSLAINLLSYIVSPDKISDKAKGGKKILINVILSIILLATYNLIFNTAYKVQYAVLDKQIIPQIVFGVKSQEVDKSKTEISYYIMSSLFTVNKDVDRDGVCKNMYFNGINDRCEELLQSKLGKDYNIFLNGVRTKTTKNLLSSGVIDAESDGGFVFEYRYILTTIVMVIVGLIILGFCLDIAKRSVKLYFYQLIAPLPIMSNIIPGKGEETFKKWYKSCITTYLDVFIRLIALFFAIYLISILYQAIGDVFSDHKLLGTIVVLGALMFAKELPQLIQDLTGIKMDGTFTINPLKKLNQVPLVASSLGALGGAFAGGRAGGRVGNRLGGALTGAAMGFSSTPLAGSKDGSFAFTSAANGVYKRMVGTDFINFSFLKAPLRAGGKERVQEIKDARNAATKILNEYNTDLNTSEALTSTLMRSLSSAGIDVSNINDGTIAASQARLKNMQQRIEKGAAGYEKAKRDFASASSNISSLKSEIEAKTAALNSAQNELRNLSDRIASSDPSDSALADLKARQTELQSQISRDSSDISKKKSSLSSLESTSSSLSSTISEYEKTIAERDELSRTVSEMVRYRDGLEEQNELRARIAVVQKDIDDLSSEKSQRERFYEYDPSPSDDIKKIRKATESEESYKSRVDEKIGKSNN